MLSSTVLPPSTVLQPHAPSIYPSASLPVPCSLQGNQVVGILTDEADPAVSVMKVEQAPTESYADVGGLEQQIQEVGARLVDTGAPRMADALNCGSSG